MSIIDNYQKIKQHIEDVAYQCGRNPLDIELLPVTKGREWSECKYIYQLGLREFAESRLQDAEEKILHSPEDILWHFIGPLQKNKVRKVIQYFECIHSVDTFELAEKISLLSIEEESVTRILLQVNTSGEETKQGFAEEEVKQLFDKIWELPGLKLEGFMTIAPHVEDERIIRKCFAKLWNIKDEIEIRSGGAISLPHLSMGMSNDYPLAILEGATILRIGSALFD